MRARVRVWARAWVCGCVRLFLRIARTCERLHWAPSPFFLFAFFTVVVPWRANRYLWVISFRAYSHVLLLFEWIPVLVCGL